MFNLLKSDLYRLVHGKMLWVGLASLAFVVVCAAALIWFATTPEFAQMVNEQAQENAQNDGETGSLTISNDADFTADEVELLNQKTIESRTYSYGNTFMVGFLGLIVSVIAALFVSSDFDTGFVKNVLAGRRKRLGYFAGKLTVIALLCGVFLLVGMLLTDAVYAIAGFSYDLVETVGEYWSWAGLSWLVLMAYAYLAALIVWAVRSKAVGIVFAGLFPTGFIESMALSGAAVLAPAIPAVGDLAQWLPLSVQQRLAPGGPQLFAGSEGVAAGLPPATQALIVFGVIVVACAALSLTVCKRKDV